MESTFWVRILVNSKMTHVDREKISGLRAKVHILGSPRSMVRVRILETTAIRPIATSSARKRRRSFFD